MVDPLLGGFDMPVLIQFPIAPKGVPRLDAILVTHADNDHYSIPTCRDLSSVTRAYHSTRYVDLLMKKGGYLPLVMTSAEVSASVRYGSGSLRRITPGRTPIPVRARVISERRLGWILDRDAGRHDLGHGR